MSGPKLIELRRMRAAAERQRNHDRCASFGSEYARLLKDYLDWGAKLRELGVTTEDVMRPLESVRDEIDALLRQESHHEAARIFGEQVSCLRGEVEHRRQQFQERLVNLQNRHRQASRECALLAENLSRLRERINTTIPSQWPQTEKERIQNVLKPLLDKITCPTAPPFPHNAQSVHQLETTEEIVRDSSIALEKARQQLEAELNASHQHLLLDSLVPEASTTPSLAQILERFSCPTPATAENKLEDALEQLCVELATVGDLSFSKEIRLRAEETRATDDAAHRRLLTDSLLIEGARRLKERRELTQWKEEIQKLIDAAAHVQDSAVDVVVAELRALLLLDTRMDLNPPAHRLRETLILAEAKREREFRRKALIDSLQELGYETHENLETAFVKEGKVVLHRPGEEDYGVEMVASSDLNQLQTALVRFSDNSDLTDQQRRRDYEREESWCQDHASLREKMAARGLETPFKMQLKPGEHPVRVVMDKNRTKRARSEGAGDERLRGL